ncbi:zinc-binding dehydrogenase [Planococcus sp. ANT_H30]|uniref:zinc-binding dehydrogenase n=1 Tax=Planococcus sp. ANT_H30 TaxID=2597347 RepID=UPI0011EC4C58|nr:zinc-binding dehydrogenase [Planococcus sp. ANT_H30]KAA0957291.1 zinc-binding dehydrogenase [Planococcus sp. ANT_H30]
MKAFVMESGEWKLKDMPEPLAKSEEVVVSLKAAGINRRDLGLIKRYGDNPEAMIVGSDGAGIVESVGEDVIDFAAGDEVIINPALRWYTNSEGPPVEFDILGMPDHGTFAEKITVSAEQLEKKPHYLSWEEAGSLALPALTGYRALFTKGQVKKGETLFIPGAGSGVATFLVQFAKNIGARVIVTSRSEEKRQHAQKIGADRTIATDSDWVEEMADETIDLVIDSVGGATFNRSLDILKKGGRIVIFGATTEDTVDFNLRQFFYGQYQLFGSTMGSREELRDMLDHMESYNMRPVVDKTYSLDQAQEAFDYLASGNQFGKVVLKISE